ncbi:MAG: D-alanyl-D-alanine carboxypeptidase family protein, partial [Actinomycetes bacterium]
MPRHVGRAALAFSVTALLLLVGAAPSYAGPAPTALGRAESDDPVGGELLSGSGVVVDAGADAPALPTVKAKAYVVADAETGEVLAARAPHAPYRPASTLKVLTALTLLPELPPDSEYVARDEDARAEGSRVGLVPDHTYTVHQLFQGLLMVSGNDAASAVANAAGGLRPTVRKMNAMADHLQAYDTTAVNSSGLDAPGQFSSAYDLALLGRAALAEERLRQYTTATKATFPGKGKKTYEIWTINRLLYNFDGTIGVKTGWTTKARGTYIGAARRGGRTLIATVMHTEDDSWQDSERLLRWGFHAAGTVEPVGALVGPAEHGDAPDRPGSGAAASSGTA